MINSYIQTPLLESIPLSKEIGLPVYLKMEALQPSGSYKDRGLGLLLSDYMKRGLSSFITASYGNSGLSLAMSAKTLGLKLKVVVPKESSLLMKDKIEMCGAEVIVEGNHLEAAAKAAIKIAAKENLTYIDPYENPLIFEGISTIVYEIFGDGVKPGCILLPAGCGDLLVGVMKGLHACKWGNIPIITSELENSCPLATALFAGETQAKGVIPEVFLNLKHHKITPNIVTEKAAFDAAFRFANEHRVLLEWQASTPLALVYQNLPLLKTFSSVLIIVTGGSNVNLSSFLSPVSI